MAEILTIENGVIQGTSIAGVPLVHRFARHNTGRAFPNRKLRKYSGVAMHDTGNTNAGADALAHAQFVQDVEDNKTAHASGYHFAVDDKRIVQIIPVTDVAWHAGDGSSGVGNNEYIAIELCINRDRNKAKSERNAQILAASLLATLGGELKKHQDFSGKDCPGTLLHRWPEFRGVIMGLRDSVHTVTTGIDDEDILGEESMPADTALAWILSKVDKSVPKLTCDLADLVDYYWQEGKAEGVRPEVALSLSIKETGFWRYGGIVQPEQNNFGGLGALNENASGEAASFIDCQIGVRAVVQHMRAYATREALRQGNVDPRYEAVIKAGYHGQAPTVHGLSGKWAWPGFDRRKHPTLAVAYLAGETYGQEITQMYRQMLDFAKTYEPEAPVTKVGRKGVFARRAADIGAALRIVHLVPDTVLINPATAAYDDYGEIIQVGGEKEDGVSVHLGGRNRFETDTLVDVWIRAQRKDG